MPYFSPISFPMKEKEERAWSEGDGEAPGNWELGRTGEERSYMVSGCTKRFYNKLKDGKI